MQLQSDFCNKLIAIVAAYIIIALDKIVKS